jgi:hypothetical protein
MVEVLLLLPAMVGALLLLLSLPFQVVSRARVVKLARRQSLPITVANGPIVIGYLATTRRWRGTGVLLSVVAGLLHARLTGSGSDVEGAALFAGWFVGAVVAEWRVSVHTSGVGSRRASLVPRRLSDYLPGHVRFAVLIAGALLLSAESAALLSNSRQPELIGWLALTLATAAVIGAVGRHILSRPQPVAADDVLAADEAIRSRSLHVLAGAALAITGYFSAAVLSVGVHDLSLLAPWSGAVAILLPLLGLVLACATSRPPARLARLESRELLGQ